MKRLLALVVVFLCLVGPAAAVNPGEMLADPALEARARDISANLRCLVCQNESIDDSEADLAHDLRVLVRDRLKAGDTNAEAKQYIVDRYGEFVLLKPVFAWHTLILWIAAPGILVAGLVFIVAGARRRRYKPAGTVRLTASEQAAIESLRKQDGAR